MEQRSELRTAEKSLDELADMLTMDDPRGGSRRIQAAEAELRLRDSRALQAQAEAAERAAVAAERQADAAERASLGAEMGAAAAERTADATIRYVK